MNIDTISQIKKLLTDYTQSEIDLKQSIDLHKELSKKIETLMQKIEDDRKILFQHLTLFFIEKTNDVEFMKLEKTDIKQIGNIQFLLGLPEV